jgi:hypothetical protein
MEKRMRQFELNLVTDGGACSISPQRAELIAEILRLYDVDEDGRLLSAIILDVWRACGDSQVILETLTTSMLIAVLKEMHEQVRARYQDGDDDP